MDYNYETLLDQRFQMLCQSLLLTEYENVQCFPVGKADGGRDATSRAEGRLETVFQVKYSHNPSAIKKPAKWIIDSLEGEKEKIKRLKDRGASRYVLITNAFPTSNLDSGAIDQVNEYLDKNIPIEAYCWWRDDLDRRLDSNFDLKLKYPTLLSGADMLRLLWENLGNKEETARRKMALSAYFAHQAEQDSTIRFKQAELLPSSLLDLFIDVPALPRGAGEGQLSGVFKGYVDHVMRKSQKGIGSLEERENLLELQRLVEFGYFEPGRKVASGFSLNYLNRPGVSIGAAELLLDSRFNDNYPFIVLEGAPGQGKTTLSQYLAQLQRLRILDRKEDLKRVPAEHEGTAVMLPLKIELRDLASWIKGVDPWAGAPNTTHAKPSTLEGAVAGHVEKYSGGFSFNVADLAFVIQARPVLLILDALDEVADMDDRRAVVEEVVAGVARLRQGAENLKVLVTSRPTAVAGAPSFPHNLFEYLSLAPIPTGLASTYAQKWGKARKLRKADIEDIGNTLDQKLSAPHMAELAKNTMQLSILLSLIYHRGSSLPDKRTELYDAYIDSFFNREVEKSAVVREHRVLLVNLHQHLAYYMHSQAESSRTTGRITQEELTRVVKEYLVRHKEAEGALDSLLTGVVERVVALVSRVEGTYEFEVQPLREYFAARYLYDTAPYVPATSVGHGTKPDRFDGIARNPYWMNVTRFFAGCFTQGELLDLAERVCSLCDAPEMQGNYYPRALALALLQDWVFSQSNLATEKVIDKVFDDYGIRSSYLADVQLGRSPWQAISFDLALSKKIGSKYLVETKVSRLFSAAQVEDVRALAHVLGKQVDMRDSLRDRWQEEYRSARISERMKLLDIARWMRLQKADIAPSTFSSDEDSELLAASLNSPWAGPTVPDAREREVVLAVLNSPNQYSTSSDDSPLSRVLGITSTALWSYALQSMSPGVFVQLPRREQIQDQSCTASLFEIAEFVVSRNPDSLQENLDAWRFYVEHMEREFGPTWNTWLISLMSGHVKANDERVVGVDGLFSQEHSSCDCIRYAKRKSKQADWWLGQLELASTAETRERWLSAAYCWASATTLSEIWVQFEACLNAVSQASFNRLFRLAEKSRFVMRDRLREEVRCPASWFRSVNLSSRMLSIFFQRFPAGAAKDRVLSKRATQDMAPELAGRLISYAWQRLAASHISEDEFFRAVKKFYLPEVLTQGDLPSPSSAADKRMLRPVCMQLVQPGQLTADIVMRSAETILRSTAKKSRPVLRTANREKWFAQ
ncbi:NACHT domain-containing protein [Streptomyces olivochromogenes]|uniref:NACHT domain-containing protein n=1 Tax=Streptomyces olivochromogenes TaxID=1963 RepID=UPI001F3382F0|nr:NACHT domain-containing protein [Streptomyces olivochromogenes]MCF3130234.1 NACHT domain-containing protein [Streptomyces olivochromogenes]